MAFSAITSSVPTSHAQTACGQAGVRDVSHRHRSVPVGNKVNASKSLSNLGPGTYCDIVEPEQKFIAEQRFGYHVPATTNSNKRVVAG
jgi:hypothetical protein